MVKELSFGYKVLTNKSMVDLVDRVGNRAHTSRMRIKTNQSGSMLPCLGSSASRAAEGRRLSWDPCHP